MNKNLQLNNFPARPKKNLQFLEKVNSLVHLEYFFSQTLFSSIRLIYLKMVLSYFLQQSVCVELLSAKSIQRLAAAKEKRNLWH